MPVRLQAIIDTAASDNVIDVKDVTDMLTEVNKNGITSDAERADLETALAIHGSIFEDDARAALETFLGGGTPPPPPPTGDAEGALDQALAAASGGGISAAELEAAQAAVSASFGADEADRAMAAVLTSHASALTTDAVRALQRGPANLEGHVTRLQAVMVEHLAGALILDVDLDGILEATDLVFTGSQEAREIGEVLVNKVKIGAAIMGAARDLAAARPAFELIKNHRFAPSHWETIGNGSFQVKAGVSPSEALMDIFQNTDAYGFECATAMVIVYYKAMLDLIGAERFDAVCGDLQIGPWVMEDDLRGLRDTDGSSFEEADAARRAELRPGDYTYFKNWDVSDEGRAAGWQGENVIYLGRDANGTEQYYGHPFGVSTEDHIVEYLNRHRNPDSTRTSSMLELQSRVNDRILDLGR
jgi:protein-glutamine gamma-glutamyltransferase